MGEEFTHGQFANDTKVIIEAKLEYVNQIFQLFRTMGDTSGLYVKEVGVKATLISNQDMPSKLSTLDWNWETNTSLSKLLGVFVGEDISPQDDTTTS